MAATPVKVFIVYAHEDKSVRDKLLRQLRPLADNGDIDLWSDHEIHPGAVWDDEIRQRLHDSQLIILLVSDDFFASDYIRNIELREALDRHQRGEVRLLPVIARYCGWEDVTAIASLQVLPTGGRPIISKEWDSPDEAYRDVFQGVKAALRELQGPTAGRTAAAPAPSAHMNPGDLSATRAAAVAPPPAQEGLSTRKTALVGALLLLVATGIWGVLKFVRQPEPAKGPEPSSQLVDPKTTTDQPVTQAPPETTLSTQAALPNNTSGTKRSAEDSAWTAVQQENTIGAYKKFLDDYPKGVHQAEANTKLTQLQTEFNSYIAKAEMFLAENKITKTKYFLEKARKLAPLHPKVVALDKKLAQK